MAIGVILMYIFVDPPHREHPGKEIKYEEVEENILDV